MNKFLVFSNATGYQLGIMSNSNYPIMYNLDPLIDQSLRFIPTSQPAAIYPMFALGSLSPIPLVYRQSEYDSFYTESDI